MVRASSDLFWARNRSKRPFLVSGTARSIHGTARSVNDTGERAMAVSWLLAAGERHSSARRSIRMARPGPIEPPRRAGHADMRTTHIGVKATELQHQQTSLTLNQKHNVEPWGGIANPRTPLLAHAAGKCISAPYPVSFLSVPILSNPSTRPQATDHSRCCHVPIQQCRTVESDKHRPVQWRHALGPENVAGSAYLGDRRARALPSMPLVGQQRRGWI